MRAHAYVEGTFSVIRKRKGEQLLLRHELDSIFVVKDSEHDIYHPSRPWLEILLGDY